MTGVVNIYMKIFYQTIFTSFLYCNEFFEKSLFEANRVLTGKLTRHTTQWKWNEKHLLFDWSQINNKNMYLERQALQGLGSISEAR